MSGVFFVSDLHLSHALVQRIRSERGLAIAAEHDDLLAENWDRAIKTGDMVYVLGDLTLESNPTRALEWISDRPGRKVFVAGNHDAVHPGHRDAVRNLHKAPWLAVFEAVTPFFRIRVLGQPVLLSHFPYPGTSEGTDANGRPFDDRYAQYRLPNLGIPLVHGHTHRQEKLSFNRRPGVAWQGKGTPQIHVGVDAWQMSPVPLNAIEDLLMEAQK